MSSYLMSSNLISSYRILSYLILSDKTFIWRLSQYWLVRGAFSVEAPGKKKRLKRKRLVGRGGALVETMTFNRRVVGSTSALAAT